MAASEWTITICVERAGLLYHVYLADSGKRIGTIDLKSELELTDEQAAEMLAKLDAADRQLEEVL